jgi:hypothetical protein
MTFKSLGRQQMISIAWKEDPGRSGSRPPEALDSSFHTGLNENVEIKDKEQQG